MTIRADDLTPTIAPPDPNPKKPRITLPPLSCDSHFHVFGPHSKFPYAANRPFTPTDAPKEDLFRLHEFLGIQRGVFVQSTCHGTDNRVLVDLLAAGKGRYRGAALLDPSVADAWVTVDKRRFGRVMANLLENAALYGGGATDVRARRGPEDPEGRPTVWVTVEDHGPGVSPDERSRVFERFYRGQASGQRGAGNGTGLGLALVAEHVRLQGGRVWADQTDGGGGARFTIELPVTDGDSW